MLAILSGVVGLLFLLWMFHDFIWTTPPSTERQCGKPDQPIEYNLVHTTVSHAINVLGKGARVHLVKVTPKIFGMDFKIL